MTPEERKKDRVKKNNEKLKQERKQKRADNGLPEWGSLTKDYDKKASKNWYLKNRQEVLRKNKEKYEAESKARKEAKSLLAKQNRILSQLQRNEQRKEERRLAKIERNKLKEVKVKKQAILKLYKPLKKKKVDKPIPEPKPLHIRDIDLTQLIPVMINSKTKVYVKPGTDIEQVRKKFESRRI